MDGRVYEIVSPGYTFGSKGTNRQHSSQRVKIFQTELMAEIHSKSPVRVIGKVLPMT